MLFYNQIKREFSAVSFKNGQNLFRESRVKGVRLDGNVVSAKISDPDGKSYDSSLTMARGTVVNSDCNCSKHHVSEKHCSHIAGLSIWMIERGSLLRAGVGTTEDGIDEDGIQEIQKKKPKKKEDDGVRAIKAEPVIFVRGVFNHKVLSAITAEASVRYMDPVQGIQVEMVAHLLKQAEERVWKTSSGKLIRLTHELLPFLNTVDGAKLIYQGQAALENLFRFLISEYKSQIVFHSNVEVQVEPKPLKLKALNIGNKADKSRQLTYEFANENITIHSDELALLALEGKLHPNYVWKGNKIYKFETSLTTVAKYANRSGIAVPENSKSGYNPNGYAYLEDDGQHPLHPLAAYRLSLELGVENFTVDQDWKEFHEWKKNFEKRKTAALPKLDYGFELRDYQINGLTWLWSLYHRRLAALLADDMGLGKTHQVLAFLTTIYNSKSKPKEPTLVVAPTSVVAAWVQKLNKYPTRLNWHVFHGKGRVLPDSKCNLVLTTYGILQKESALREREWHTVVLDEAQAIKNASTISSRASRILKSKFKIAMTGTPVENQSTDLWSVMEFLLPGYLGSLPRFKRLYGSGREVPSVIQSSALKRLISPFLLRRTKSQVLKELPEKTEEVLICEMTPVQKKLYKDYLNSSEANKLRDEIKAGGKIDYAGILAMLTRLKQVCDHPKLPQITAGKIKNLAKVDALESGKWEAFDELIEEALRSDLKVVVFSQYLGMMDIIAHHLETRGVGYTELRGDTIDRSKPLKAFAEDSQCKVFLCSLLAGGLGIDLTAGSVCIHFDRWWNPAKENQATDRLHRFGQTRGVQVFKLQIQGTIEDRIASIIESKNALSGALIEESPLWLKVFSRKELLDLLSEDVSFREKVNTEEKPKGRDRLTRSLSLDLED